MRALVAFSILCFGGSCFAGECDNIMSLSTGISIQTIDKSEFEEDAKAFCSQYGQASDNRNSTIFEIATAKVSGFLGISKSRKNEIASKICKASNSSELSDTAYQSYIRSIDSNAVRAYEVCQTYNNVGISFDFDVNSVGEEDFTIVAKYRGGRESSAKFHFTKSDGVDCEWDTNSSGTEIQNHYLTIQDVGNASLKCKRNDSSRNHNVTVVETNFAESRPLRYVWTEYKDGIPVNRLRELQHSFKGSVVAFDSIECPRGWKEYEYAYGRFVRGIDRTEQNIDPEGLREPGTHQGDDFKKHNHTGVYGVHQHAGTGSPTHMSPEVPGHTPEHHAIEWSVVYNGGDETRPKNVALLYCIRT